MFTAQRFSVGGSVAHTLTGRYVLGGKNEFKGSCRSILGSNEN